MKLRLPLICIAIAALLFLSACTSEMDVDVSCDDFMKQNNINKEIKVAVDDVFTVTLCSNPTTGFQWDLPQITDQAVLQQIDHKFMSPSSGAPNKALPPGTPGQDIWTFRALEKGTSMISAEYSRPWEGGEKAAWTFDLTVVVK
jgi:inhibitor of cysteine peptidase